MTSTAIITATKMMEKLSEDAQQQAVEYLRNYIAEMQDEKVWDDLFAKTENQLVAAARKAKKEIAEGQAKPTDINRL